MTLADLRTLAERDSASPDPRTRKAGQYAQNALEALEKKDWTAAIVALAKAITKQADAYVPAILLVGRIRGGAAATPAQAAASRLNGAKGGRPRKYPDGWRAAKQSTRKPGETRGRKPKNKDQEKGGDK